MPSLLCFALGALAAFGQTNLLADPPLLTSYADSPWDSVIRPTDPGANAPFDPSLHHPVELIEIRLGRWTSTDPQFDLFQGTYAPGAGFFRLDLLVEGVVNPPGDTDPGSFDPFRYGPHPIYGFIEIDMDDDNDTGGEVAAPQYRYLANVARFGGLPEANRFEDRLASDSSDIDAGFTTAPFIERSGEEFHLAFLGGQFVDWEIDERTGDGDLIFESDEVWVVKGEWFHRAHGFEPFSLAWGGSVPGEYAPPSLLRFAHDSQTDRTLVSLVFPLTNAASADQRGESPEAMNHDPGDQASISEALRDLILSAQVIEMFPTGMPDEALILPWKDKAFGQWINPSNWRLTALLGTTYTNPATFFVWTDVFPNPIRGNVDGKDGIDTDDVESIEEEIEAHDGDDGLMDGRIVLADYAEGFSVMDVNHSGVIDDIDVALLSPVGDCDQDGDVDLGDFAVWQRCVGAEASSIPCALADLDGDETVDAGDATWFLSVLTGPQ